MNRDRQPDPDRQISTARATSEIRLGEYVPGLGFRVISPPSPITPEMQAILDEEWERISHANPSEERGGQR